MEKLMLTSSTPNTTSPDPFFRRLPVCLIFGRVVFSGGGRADESCDAKKTNIISYTREEHKPGVRVRGGRLCDGSSRCCLLEYCLPDLICQPWKQMLFVITSAQQIQMGRHLHTMFCEQIARQNHSLMA